MTTCWAVMTTSDTSEPFRDDGRIGSPGELAEASPWFRMMRLPSEKVMTLKGKSEPRRGPFPAARWSIMTCVQQPKSVGARGATGS